MINNKEVILISGGCGLIGQQIAKSFAQSFKVVALDIKEPKNPIPNVSFVKMNVSEQQDITRALNEIKTNFGDRIASVIHLAAFYSFDVGESELYDKITVKGTENLLAGLKDFSVEQFIFSSTMLVHAPGKVGSKINENSLVDPKWAYPKSKVDAEKIIKDNHNQIPCLILRIAGVYDDRCHSIPIANHIERIYEHHLTSHFFPGDIEKGQAFVHMDDLIKAFSKAVEKRKTLPEELTLILGEEESLSFRELQNELGQRIHGTDWLTQRIPISLAWCGAKVQEHVPIVQKPFIKSWMVKLADHHYDLDITKAKKYLDWEPQHSLRGTLPKMIALLKSKPDVFYQENKISPPITMAISFRKALPTYAWLSALGTLFYVVTNRKKST
jgi:nucleoside-diphosphate-sugar epimerase